MIYTDVRLKIPSPVPFCTFYRWENRASLMSHPIGPKCACRHFFLAFFVLTLCTILFMSKMKGGGLWVFTWENAQPTRVPCRGELLIYYCVYTFTSFLLITCPCDDVILVWVRCITHSSPVGGRFDTETKGRSSFTDTVCKISHRDEILRTAQQPGWTRAGMTVSGSIM